MTTGSYFRYTAMQEYKGDLYFCGNGQDTPSLKSYSAVIKWNGNAFCTIAKSIWGKDSISNDVPLSMAVYNNELFVGGGFVYINGVRVSNIARWNGYQWHAAGTGVRDTLTNGVISGNIECLTVYNNELYACGHFSKAGNVAVSNIAYWDGSQWHDPAGGLLYSKNRLNADAYNMAVFQNKLFVTGDFDSAGNVSAPNIATWNGVQWDSVKNGAFGTPSMAIYNGTLCLAGYLQDTILPEGIQRWDGKNWITPLPYPPIYLGLSSLFTFNGKLYACGSGICEYNANTGTWKTIVDSNGNVFIFSNPTVYENELYFCEYIQSHDSDVFIRIHFPGDTSPPPFYKIYPNPSTDYFTIETINPTQNMDFELFNSTGQRILTGRLLANVCCQNIHLKNVVAAGLYFIRIRDGVGWHIEKLMFVD